MKNLKFYNLKRRVGALVLAVTMLGSVAVGCGKKENKDDEIISIIQSEDGIENNILKYIDISEKLEKLNLEDYNLDEIVSGSPDTVEEIERQINNYNEKNRTNLRYLITQEILVNKYIYETGYQVAYENAKVATKNYVAEKFGIEDPNSIGVSYNNPNNYNANNQPDETVVLEFDTIYGSRRVSTKDKNIIDGSRAMANTQTNSDPDTNDNTLYNSDRNNTIKDALVTAKSLEQLVENTNLLDEYMVNKIR